MMPAHRMSSPFGTPPNGQPRKNGYHKPAPRGIEEMKLQESSLKNKMLDRDMEKSLELTNSLKNANFFQIPDLVKKYQGTPVYLPQDGEVTDLYLHVCGLDGTVYSGERFMLDSWEKLYLPKPTRMEVLGILDRKEVIVPVPKWVVLVGEDGRVYGFYEEELHLLSHSVKGLIQYGIEDTGISYSYPTEISDEEEEVLQEDEEIQRLRTETRKFIDQDADEFNEFLSMF